MDQLPCPPLLRPSGLPCLRPAVPGDAPALAVLVNSAYRGDSSRAGWTTEADLLDGQRTDAEMLEAILRQRHGVILVLEREGELLGCVHLERSGAGCQTGMLTVAPERQAGGIGRHLLVAAERFAVREWQAAFVALSVIAHRAELIAWYERRGYHRTGERRPFPYGNDRFGLPRRDDLEFIVMEKQFGNVMQ
jgi:ribosomal protein S18 acetylase RimI-like enzyme